MAELFLVCHSISAPPGTASDAARALTAEGRTRFRALAEACASRITAKRIFTSPLRRARETAEILAAALSLPTSAVEQSDALASGASGGEAILALALEHAAPVIFVGHNPEIQEALLLAGNRENVGPGTIAALSRHGGARFRVDWVSAL